MDNCRDFEAMTGASENIIFFKKAAQFRAWLKKNFDQENELWVGYYKKHTEIPSISWEESVDEALCFGWIDGVRKSIDERSYCIRFTPRREKSNWSQVNIKKVEVLKRLKKMAPPGVRAYENRPLTKSGQYSYERATLKLDPQLEARFKDNLQAWAFFQNLAPSFRKTSVRWVMSAKREATRLKRLKVLIESSENGLKIPQLRK